MSRSQAPLYLYTPRLVSEQPEGTFGRLRYILGGDRPSQTTRLTMSPDRIHGPGLEPQNHKGGISPVAPRNLTILRESGGRTVSGGQFYWGGILLKSNGGVQSLSHRGW